MISGRLERLFSEGYVEGWAFDSQSPQRPLAVDIRVEDGGLVAQGLAHGYRDDLADARLGLGWCAYRLKLSRPEADLGRGSLALHDTSTGLRIDYAAQMRRLAGNPYAGSLAQSVATFDPFVIARVSQLRACQELFARCLSAKGTAGFVRTAYMYMVGRSADPESLALYGEMLGQATLTPLQLLEMIAETEEFRARPRELAAPNTPGFPFLEAANA